LPGCPTAKKPVCRRYVRRSPFGASIMFSVTSIRFSLSSLLFGGVGFAAALLIAPGLTGAADAPTDRPPRLKSRVVTWDEARPHRGDWGEMRAHFTGETFGTRDAFVAIAVVEPGGAVHAAHRHAEEEYLI